MSRRSALRALADRMGIEAAYQPIGGGRPRRTRDSTREALLAAMGVDASSEAAARAALRAHDEREAAQLVAPFRVATERARELARLPIRAPAGATRGEWRVEITEEDGTRTLREGSGTIRRTLPSPVPHSLGYHRLSVRVRTPSSEHRAAQTLVVAPRQAANPSEALGKERGVGVTANLSGLRSPRNYGVGDFGDLRELARHTARSGGGFVGLNPLHALWNRGAHVVPYAPLSRRFGNELHLDLDAIPEASTCAAYRRCLASSEVRRTLERVRASDRIDHRAVATLKRRLLLLLHAEFRRRHRDRSTRRGRAYARFRAREGTPLQDFATFVAIGEARFAARGAARALDWRQWPQGLRDPRGGAVREFADTHREDVDFHTWVQFEFDRQLAGASRAARNAGLGLGLYLDLPVGTDPGGYDPWAEPHLFAHDASVGAPPDDFAAAGQDWGIAPLVPEALRADGFRHWIGLLRHALAHARALRIDHVMGLERLYWIPRGRAAREGAYVRQPAAELLGILALESRRHGATIVGEDLGTVPAGLRARLARRGVLSTRVLYFERDGARYRAAARYPARAIVSANTHDLVPLAGFGAASDLALRARAGDGSSAARRRALAERRRAYEGLLRRLRRDGLLPPARAGEPSARRLHCAVVAFLERTPARLVAISLDDLAEETEPINLPGLPQARHASWTRRLRATLDEIFAQS